MLLICFFLLRRAEAAVMIAVTVAFQFFFDGLFYKLRRFDQAFLEKRTLLWIQIFI